MHSILHVPEMPIFTLKWVPKFSEMHVVLIRTIAILSSSGTDCMCALTNMFFVIPDSHLSFLSYTDYRKTSPSQPLENTNNCLMKREQALENIKICYAITKWGSFQKGIGIPCLIALIVLHWCNNNKSQARLSTNKKTMIHLLWYSPCGGLEGNQKCLPAMPVLR